MPPAARPPANRYCAVGAAPSPGAKASTAAGGTAASACAHHGADRRGGCSSRRRTRRFRLLPLAASAGSAAGAPLGRGPRSDPGQAARERGGSAGQGGGAIVAAQLRFVLERAAGETVERLERQRARDQPGDGAPQRIVALEMRELVRECGFELLGFEPILERRRQADLGAQPTARHRHPRRVGQRQAHSTAKLGATREVVEQSQRLATSASPSGEEPPVEPRAPIRQRDDREPTAASHAIAARFHQRSRERVGGDGGGGAGASGAVR